MQARTKKGVISHPFTHMCKHQYDRTFPPEYSMRALLSHREQDGADRIVPRIDVSRWRPYSNSAELLLVYSHPLSRCQYGLIMRGTLGVAAADVMHDVYRHVLRDAAHTQADTRYRPSGPL